MASKIVGHFVLEKVTKGALRYKQTVNATDPTELTMENGGADYLGSSYLRRDKFPDGKYPQRITVEVTTVD